MFEQDCDCRRCAIAERDRLRDLIFAFANAVNEAAFSIPAPNTYTPKFLMISNTARNKAAPNGMQKEPLRQKIQTL